MNAAQVSGLATSNVAGGCGLLRRVPLFALLGERELSELSRIVEHRHYSRHALIVTAGDKVDGLYLIVSGRARVLIADGEGREVTLGTLVPNEFFGEMSLIDGLPQSKSLQALESCKTIYVPRHAFISCFQNNLEALALLLRTVVARLRSADRQIESFALLDVTGRVARVLSETALQVEGRWVAEIGSQRLACTVAASREMISRVLRNLQSAGVIARMKRKIVLLDRGALAQLGTLTACSAREACRPPKRRAAAPVTFDKAAVASRHIGEHA